jgi:hypothetical protein
MAGHSEWAVVVERQTANSWSTEVNLGLGVLAYILCVGHGEKLQPVVDRSKPLSDI